MLVFCFNAPMDIDAYRRARLQDLVDKAAKGNAAEFARLHKEAVTATRLRQLLNPNYRGGEGFKEGAARKLEKTLGLPNLYFDLGIENAIAEEHKTGTIDESISGTNAALIKELPKSPTPSIGRESAEKSVKNVRPGQLGQREIPVISYVQAGMMTEVVDPFALGDGLETIATDLELSDGAFALIIEGPSMLPEFNEGDKVIIDPALSPRPGDFVVGKNGKEEATFKKYRPRGTSERGEMVFELVPLNDDFPILHSERDHLRVIGVMVEHRKYRRR